MNGQWIGLITGTNTGQAVIELDDDGTNYTGSAYFYDDNRQNPALFAPVTLAKGQLTQKTTLPVLPLDGSPALISNWPDFTKKYPHVSPITSVTVDWIFMPGALNVSWTSSAGTNGSARLTTAAFLQQTGLEATGIKSWDGFKAYVATLEPYRYIFRGQTGSDWRLRTSFHRTGRSDLAKFSSQDLPELLSLLTNKVSHLFDLANQRDLHSFYALAQHHGYPTPLLDWTHSPFIAAYFAMKGIKKVDRVQGRFVRVFVFDKQQWTRDHLQITHVGPQRPHFSILNTVAINNERLVPQQALLTITNVDDIEGYIRWVEQNHSRKYLQVFDLFAVERQQVMQELALMGITAGSLFPGLDGACEQLRERFFDL